MLGVLKGSGYAAAKGGAVVGGKGVAEHLHVAAMRLRHRSDQVGRRMVAEVCMGWNFFGLLRARASVSVKLHSI